MKYSLLLLIGALQLAACGGSSPTAPTPPPVVTPPPVTPPPPVIATIQTSACPTSTTGVDLNFYREMGCNAFESPLQPVRRWMVRPKVYIRTIDEAGAPIDNVTLDTVQNAMIEVAPLWTNGHEPLEGVLRGTETREGVSGWITVKWPATAAAAPSCASSDIGRDGGTIELNYKVGGGCACNVSAIRPRTARHELGHALGYYHTDSPNDLMSGQQVVGCDAQPSARELQAAAFHYR